MKREECLATAADIVNGDRSRRYGDIEDSFGRIADLWQAYLGHKVSPRDVAMMMILLKMARGEHNPAHADNYVDIAGYAACIAEAVTE